MRGTGDVFEGDGFGSYARVMPEGLTSPLMSGSTRSYGVMAKLKTRSFTAASRIAAGTLSAPPQELAMGVLGFAGRTGGHEGLDGLAPQHAGSDVLASLDARHAPLVVVQHQMVQAAGVADAADAQLA